MAAYEDVLAACSTEAAPWYVIPANRNWFRNLAIADIVADTLDDLEARLPARDGGPHGRRDRVGKRRCAERRVARPPMRRLPTRSRRP